MSEYQRYRDEQFKESGRRKSLPWLRCTCGKGGMMGEDHEHTCPYYFKEFTDEEREEMFRKARE